MVQTGKSGKKFIHKLTENEVFPPKAVVNEDIADLDSTLPQIEDAGPAGSRERIEALRVFYENPANEGKSHSVLTDEETADRMMTDFLHGNYATSGADNNTKELNKILFGLAVECGVFSSPNQANAE